MWPDYGQIFWDMNGLGGIGDEASVFVYTYEDREIEIDLTHIQDDLYNWLNFWQRQFMADAVKEPLLPNVPMSRWKEWWDEGYRLAQKVKALLPEDADLYYMWKVPKSVWKQPTADFWTSTERFFLHAKGEPFLVR